MRNDKNHYICNMRNIFKSWKTTIIGIIALIGLGYNAYLNGGFNTVDFMFLVMGVGFIASKDGDTSHSKGIGGGGIKNPPKP